MVIREASVFSRTKAFVTDAVIIFFSVLFSVGFFGAGALMLFDEDSLTLYDKICKTKVIESK